MSDRQPIDGVARVVRERTVQRPGRDELLWAVYENTRWIPLGLFLIWMGWRWVRRHAWWLLQLGWWRLRRRPASAAGMREVEPHR